MNYSNAISYLNGFINFERLPEQSFNTQHRDIERFSRLLTRLGNPQKQFPVVHIAGTKGKGSTAAILSAVLIAAGYKVGLYTSPHLITVRERVRVNNRMISKEEFAALIARIEAVLSTTGSDHHSTFRTVFEHLTAMAFLYFARRRVDLAIIETGLGGKLDATVVVNPILSILTPIGLDHTGILGENISQIAADKAHIIKSRVTAVSAPQGKEAGEQLGKRAESVSSRLVFAPGRAEFRKPGRDSDLLINYKKAHQIFYTGRDWLGTDKFEVNLSGNFQLDNVSTVLTSIEELRSQGYRIQADDVRTGLEKVRLSGRFQALRTRPVMILDGAHNAISLRSLLEALSKFSSGQNVNVVFSSMRTKPTLQMLKMLSEAASKIYLAPITFPKSFSINELRDLSSGIKAYFAYCDNIPTAVDTALQETAPETIILATGSLYLVGEILRHLKRLPSPPIDGLIDDRI